MNIHMYTYIEFTEYIYIYLHIDRAMLLVQSPQDLYIKRCIYMYIHM